ncbi:Lysine--tRNA ligase like protein [Verticillium longisporum]|uniref:Lysyl-tRNA synthetase n=1 Tax=Verticillium longisporum TaxID=100787 RepID=A0A8I2ZJN2_VERLO|nr:Lysine--tRNA ligase like protein [Verticillium longisporum]
MRALAAGAAAVRPFHIGPSSFTSRLLRDERDRAASAEATEDRDTEFKKMRQKTLGEAGEKELFSQTHPRLKSREGRMSIAKFRTNWLNQDPPDSSKYVTLDGRIQSIRKHGNKLIFVTMVNDRKTIQGMINFKNMKPPMLLDAFKLFGRMIEKGDHISITGKPARSGTGERILEAHILPELLSPALEQIPESLTDPETKSQKRHVDMLVNPEVADTLRLKSHLMQHIRNHFLEDDFLEVQTPILAQNAGGAVARPFTTRATEFPSKELSLRVAPELWLKRLVIGGLHKVFEMGPSFRNEGIDATHNPEFTTCEFYSAYSSLEDLIRITESLLHGLATRCDDLIANELTSLPRIDVAKFAAPFQQVEFIPSLERALGLRLPNLTGPDALPELIAILKIAGIPLPGGSIPSTLPKLLDRLAAVHLEPKSFDSPAFITHHPACMSPLAKSFQCPTTGQLVSARAELFVGGRELANMYEEENDPAAQARKLAEHRVLAGQKPGEEDGELDADMEAAPLDKSYIKAMEAGLPPTGGWGCGVDRLVMLFSGANRISDCLTFGTLRNVVGLSAEGPGQAAAAAAGSTAETQCELEKK